MKPILYYAADCPDTAPFVRGRIHRTLDRHPILAWVWIMRQWKYYLPFQI